tara:strand:+ start:278 stop:961 length:684 start_codon:yes stop_codon:yes gene_type:complete
VIKKKQNFVAIILARGGSKGIKKKNLISINKKPLIYWTIKHCIESKKINSIWVSSENKKILRTARKFGAKVIMRPKSLAKDSSSSETCWLHAVKFIEQKGFEIKNIVGLQPTSPIREKKDIDRAIIKFKKNKYDSLLSAQENHEFLWKINKKNLVSNYNYRLRPRRQEMKPQYRENGSFYIFNKEKFMRSKCRLFGNIGLYVMPKICSFQIDDREDVKIVNSLRKYF